MGHVFPTIASMSISTADQLTQVRRELARRRGQLQSIAAATGIPYDTVKRIKNETGTPLYTTVRRLAIHLAALREGELAELASETEAAS